GVLQHAKLPVLYDGHLVGVYYPDLWVEKQLIVEIKAVQNLIRQHDTQLINYLVATGVDTGLLINFGESVEVRRKFREYKPKS
ncbi:MAG TPA: GxxExxY protein, partial [Pyrinomonadaceae bacterium]|nr:GxxExxY protein [Pyrinomonadaceae bacterium]